ncbi:nucleotide sugar dehydrogenase [Kitasatospora viridis]|uniref:nucleotide sugar dehydrogenase n=1 Tax=Kitasatospora viridis TaxID=281105 RepID=UPI0011A5CD3B|nr:nucleotide sugar dehydrogenase [Kitasatospora viridis]
MKVVVVGQGYVGLPLAVRAAEVGHRVIGYDVDVARVKRLVIAESYVEDIASERLGSLISSGAYRASTDPADCASFDVAVIAVPTPLRDGVPDLGCVEESARMLGRFLRPGATVVLESTSYPGTTGEVVRPILESASGLVAGEDFHLGYSPERIDPGNARWHLDNTPKVVSGIDSGSLEKVREFYASVVDRVVPVSSCETAELTKLLENTFRFVNIALINEIAMFAHELHIDVWEAIEAADTKPYGYLRFVPGPGVGGHCLPVDSSYLSWHIERVLGRRFRCVELAQDINGQMPEYVVRRLVAALNVRKRAINGSCVLLLGLSYKANTADMRETPAFEVGRILARLGADVRWADPHVLEANHGSCGDLPDMRMVHATAQELAGADAVVLLADHDGFDYAEIAAHATYVLDCRRRLAGANIEAL